jgi:hypothetical protein
MNYIYKLLPDSYYIHPKYLSMYRLAYCAITLIFIGLPAFTWLGDNLSYLYSPPRYSLAYFFSGFPGSSFFLTITLINLISFFGILWGVRTRIVSVTYTLSSIVGYSFWYSFGKIDHNLLWLIVPLFLAFAGWGDYYSIDARTRRAKNTEKKVDEDFNSMIITLFAITIAFSMFTAGFQKLITGWAIWEAEAVKGHLFENYYALKRDKLLANFFLNMDFHLLWKSMDYSALILEVGFIISVIRRQLFGYFVAAAVIFHLLVFLMFNIVFISNLVAYLVFFDWESFSKQVKSNQFLNRLRGNIAFVKSLIFTSVALFVIAFIYQLSNYTAIRFPSLIEVALNFFNIPESYQISLSLLFIGSFVVLVYSAKLYLSKLNKNTTTKRFVRFNELENQI